MGLEMNDACGKCGHAKRILEHLVVEDGKPVKKRECLPCRPCHAEPITANLDQRRAKLRKKAALIQDEEHLAYLLATFPEEERTARLNDILPLLKFPITEK